MGEDRTDGRREPRGRSRTSEQRTDRPAQSRLDGKDERFLRASDDRRDRRGDRADQADDRQRERVSGPSSAPTPGACPWTIECSTFSWIAKPTATTAASRSQATTNRRAKARLKGVPPKDGRASPQAAHPQPDRDPGDERDRGQDEAGKTPVPVSGGAQGGGERLSRTDLDEVDRVVCDEQRQSGQRPEGEPVAEVGGDRRESHVSSYAARHAPTPGLRPIRRGRGHARRGASATRGAAAGRDRARTRCCPG